jgi:hypothetical protein
MAMPATNTSRIGYMNNPPFWKNEIIVWPPLAFFLKFDVPIV